MSDATRGATAAHLHSNVEELALQAAVMRRLAESLSGGLNLEKVCKVVVDLVVEEIGALNCSLYLVDGAKRELTLAAARGRNESASHFYPDGGTFKKFALGEGVCGWVALEGKPLLIDDVHQDSRFIPSTALAGEIRSLLSVPLLADGLSSGVRLNPDLRSRKWLGRCGRARHEVPQECY